jgi:hypothetical protein
VDEGPVSVAYQSPEASAVRTSMVGAEGWRRLRQPRLVQGDRGRGPLLPLQSRAPEPERLSSTPLVVALRRSADRQRDLRKQRELPRRVENPFPKPHKPFDPFPQVVDPAVPALQAGSRRFESDRLHDRNSQLRTGLGPSEGSRVCGPREPLRPSRGRRRQRVEPFRQAVSSPRSVKTDDGVLRRV